MHLRPLALAAMLTIAGTCSANELLYTYTGNAFTSNEITSGDARLVGNVLVHFDDTTADPLDYTIKSWQFSGAGLSWTSATITRLPSARFAFGQQYEVLDWHFGGATDLWSAFSTISSGFAVDGDASDIALVHVFAGPGAITFSSGNWTVSEVAAVPEPSTYLLFGAGLALLGAARRRSQRD